jgi:hypothetical protein
MRDTLRQNRALLIERARKLERMGLATEVETGKWIVSPKAEPALQELGERGDIIKTMHRALEREGLRKRALVDAGHVTDLGNGHLRAPKGLIQRLETADIERAGKALAAQRGLQWRPAVPGNYVTGQLVGSTQLSSGRFAMIESFSGDDGLGFSLVPWQPVLGKRIGQHISGLMRNDGGIEWSLGRKRGLGL